MKSAERDTINATPCTWHTYADGGGARNGIGTLTVGIEGIGGSVTLGMEGMAGIGGTVTLGTVTAGIGAMVILGTTMAGIGGMVTLGTEGTAGIGGSVTCGTVTMGSVGIAGTVTTGTVGIAGIGGRVSMVLRLAIMGDAMIENTMQGHGRKRKRQRGAILALARPVVDDISMVNEETCVVMVAVESGRVL
ncbi:hypothetical protein TRIUR3_15413 [Triticum urartu]|uniref:Uncharacterized protein n=1 Tax=Triticum urartu TaxID=4572 RepID=M8A479_TRIUA|nr:hypothetical protein TRIUR3_15413 [Triticum urartu]